MKYFFVTTESESKKFRGQPRITLPVTLPNDVRKAAMGPHHGPLGILGLQSARNLWKLENLAKYRKEWQQLVDSIYKAAEGSLSADN